MSDGMDDEDELLFTVASVWRQERVSCPHPDLLASWLQGGLDGGAADFVRFHVEESQCPCCAAIVDDLRLCEQRAAQGAMADLRDRLLRSTATFLESRRPRA